MRERNLTRLELYINKNPCLSVNGCDRMLPRMLPEGAELVVHGPDGDVFPYKGLPD
jgi:hypothetical protein